MASAAVFFPLDLVKTRQQATEGTRKLKMLATARNILATGGPSALYSGLSVTLYGSGFAWGLYFFGYNALQQVLRRRHGQDDKPLGSADYFLAANVTGATVCVVTNPIWVVKTRMQLQDRDRDRSRAAMNGVNGGGEATASRAAATAAVGAAAAQKPVLAGHNRYSSMWDGLYKLAVQEGLPGLSRGLVPNLLNVVHGSIHIASYERLRSFTLQHVAAPASQARRGALGGPAGTVDDGLTALQTMSCAAIAKTFALITTYPLQVFRTRQHRVPEAPTAAATTAAATEALASQGGAGITGAGTDAGVGRTAKASVLSGTTPRHQYEGILLLGKNIYRVEGVAGFYKGLLTASVREIPAACVTFLVYESVKQHLS
jgi:solute carrier family 25 folate transporter 32